MLRVNPLTGEPSAISPTRRLRPKIRGASAGVCPFCPGHEHMTPPASAVLVRRGGARVVARDEGGSRVKGWSARVFPNKYPAFTPGPGGVYGYHEVLVETPRHVADPFAVPTNEYADALWLCFRRLEEIERDPRVRAVIAVKNRGVLAGASIEHTHMQLFGLPLVPPRLAVEAEAFSEDPGRLEAYVEEESRRGERIVYHGEHFTVVAIEAPRIPYELWVVPARREPRPYRLSDRELQELAWVLQRITYAYVSLLGLDSYNFWIHIAPRGVERFHWHLEIAPSLPTWGGFEKGSGMYIVEVEPEEAARIVSKAFLAPDKELHVA